MAGVDTNDPKDLPEVVEYQITVKRIRKNVKVRDHEYKKIGQDANGKDEYGYVYFDTFATKEAEVYDQRVDELDLSAVIKAVNKLDQ